MEVPSDMADIIETLVRLGDDPSSGVYLEPPASEAAVEQMQAAAQRELGQPVPEAYLQVLRQSNGLQINGAYFKSAEHLVAENLDLHQPHVLVLGHAGNVVEYLYDDRDQQFATTTLGFPNERVATFSSLAALLTSVLTEQQVL